MDEEGNQQTPEGEQAEQTGGDETVGETPNEVIPCSTDTTMLHSATDQNVEASTTDLLDTEAMASDTALDEGEVADEEGEAGDKDGEAGDKDGEAGDKDGEAGDKDGEASDAEADDKSPTPPEMEEEPPATATTETEGTGDIVPPSAGTDTFQEMDSQQQSPEAPAPDRAQTTSPFQSDTLSVKEQPQEQPSPVPSPLVAAQPRPDANVDPLNQPEPATPEPSLEDIRPNINLPMNIVWSFGMNRNVPVLNLTDEDRKIIMYPCAHVGVMYDYEKNRQHILQGHSNSITCTCISEDKHWMATGDKGPDSMVIVWDTFTGTPIQTIFDPNPDGGFVCLAFTTDARYLASLSAGKPQIMAIWDWTVESETPMVSADLDPTCGLQNYITFNPANMNFLVTNSESQVCFYHWTSSEILYYMPPLTDEDFNKPVGRYSQSIFQLDCPRALTATSLGNLVVWDNNKPLPKADLLKPTADKKALKIIKMQDAGINVLTTTDRYIVIGDAIGHVKFYDQTLKLIYWYQDLRLGPVVSVSFGYFPSFAPIPKEGSRYPRDATIESITFVIRNFIFSTAHAMIAKVTTDGSKCMLIHREHERSVHCLAAHPSLPLITIGSYAGFLKVWDYEKKQVITTKQLDKGLLIHCCTLDPKGRYLALGFTNGQVRVLDSVTLNEELHEPFTYSRDCITYIAFSHNSQYLATADAEHTTSVFKRQKGDGHDPFFYLGRYCAHYREIKTILFGVHLDSNQPRLLTIGDDRLLVEYDLASSTVDNLQLMSTDRVEQSAVPLCMAWYPPVSKEHFILTSNDQFKFKQYNATTKMCRKTLLAPTFGTPVEKIEVVPTKNPLKDTRYIAFATADKVGLHILPLDGNPHNASALIAHPGGVASIACSFDGKYLFSAGGADCTVHMWELNFLNLQAQARLGGDDLIPFYGLLDGGREGDLFKELEDYFYYAQVRSRGVNAMSTREISTKIPLSEVPFVMRALGFYPTEQEIEDMVNEVKFSRYVETGKYVEEIGIGDFVRLYVNHRPAFGLSREKLEWAFDVMGYQSPEGGPSFVERGNLLDLLQTRGEHMTEYELAEHLTTLLGFNVEGGSCERATFDPTGMGDIIDEHLPHEIDAELFCNNLLGFSMYNNPQGKQDQEPPPSQTSQASQASLD